MKFDVAFYGLQDCDWIGGEVFDEAAFPDDPVTQRKKVVLQDPIHFHALQPAAVVQSQGFTQFMDGQQIALALPRATTIPDDPLPHQPESYSITPFNLAY